MRELFVQASYLLASVFFMLGLKSLSRAETASRGVTLAAAGMLIAILGTLVQVVIIDYKWIALGLAVGTVIGVPLGTRVPIVRKSSARLRGTCSGTWMEPASPASSPYDSRRPVDE